MTASRCCSPTTASRWPPRSTTPTTSSPRSPSTSPTWRSSEREILGLLAEGRSNIAIAADLHLASRSVEKHVTAIFTKLDLPDARTDHRRVLAVLRYLNAGPAPRAG